MKYEENTYKQMIYLCRQDKLTPDGKVRFNVGLKWTPINENWKHYCVSDLPKTDDNGEDSKQFTGRHRKDAIIYAKELSNKYNLEIDVCL